MAFTLREFHDLTRLLEKHPEWQTELRRLILTQELLTLPEIVRDLAAAQKRTEQRVEELAEAQKRTEHQIEALAKAQERTEQQVQHLNNQVSELRGWQLEWRYRERAPSYFSKLVRRIHVLRSEELANLLDNALDEGRITEEQRVQVLEADVVLRGRWRQDDREVYLVAEVSLGIGVGDVTRARERAAYLSKIHPALPAVAGIHITLDASQTAKDWGVWRVLDGQTLAPSDPL